MSPRKGGIGRRPGRKGECRQKKVSATSANIHSIQMAKSRLRSTLAFKQNFPIKVTVVYANESLVCYPRYTDLKSDTKHIKPFGEVTVLQDQLKEGIDKQNFPMKVTVVYASESLVCYP